MSTTSANIIPDEDTFPFADYQEPDYVPYIQMFTNESAALRVTLVKDQSNTTFRCPAIANIGVMSFFVLYRS